MSEILGIVSEATYDRVVEMLRDQSWQQIAIAHQLKIPPKVVAAINATEKIRDYTKHRGVSWTPGPGFKPKKKRKPRGRKRSILNKRQIRIIIG